MLTFPRWAGWVWLVAGGMGIVGALMLVVFGSTFVSSSVDTAGDALSVTEDLLGTVRDSAESVDATLASVTAGLDTVESSVADGATTLTRVARVADDLGRVVSEEVPASLDAIHAAMPQLIATAGVLDGAMRALSYVGANYDPDSPLDDSLRDLDLQISVIPNQLRSQAGSLSEAAQGIADFGASSLGIATDISKIRANLDESRRVIDGYRRVADRALPILTDLADQIERQATLARTLLVVVGLALATAHSLPLAIGWRTAMRQAPPSRSV
jgi:methyl-accepting chemotaxis protein